MYNTHKIVPKGDTTMNPNNDDQTRKTTAPNTAPNTTPNTASQPRDSARSKKDTKDVIKRLSDLTSTIKKLQLELVDLTSQDPNQTSNMKKSPGPKLDGPMHFEHVSLDNEQEANKNELMKNPTRMPNVQQLNQQQYNRDDDEESEDSMSEDEND